MRVVQAARFAGPDVLEASGAPRPVTGPGRVVIGTSVTVVPIVETQVRRGWHREYLTAK
jgi:NADPH:quinone reductase